MLQVTYKHASKGLQPEQRTVATPRCPMCGALLMSKDMTISALRQISDDAVATKRQRVVGTKFTLRKPRFADELEYDRKSMTNHFVSFEVCEGHLEQHITDWLWERNIEIGIHKLDVSMSEVY